MTSTEIPTVVPPGSASGRIYEVIRRRIIVGLLPQGSRLPEQKLATELETSRIPLREALSQLDADGFVTLRPRRSAVVCTWTSAGVHHLFDSRLALEPAAANKAAQNIADGGSYPELLAALEHSEREMTSGKDLAFAEANAQFHQALVATARNPILDRLMGSITGRMAWLFHLTSQRDHEVACREHGGIVEAIASGNPRLAETLVYSHIESGRSPSFDELSRSAHRS